MTICLPLGSSTGRKKHKSSHKEPSRCKRTAYLVAHEHEGARPRSGIKRRYGGNPGPDLVLVRQRSIRCLEDAHRAVLAAADDVLRQGALGCTLTDGQGDNRPFVPPVVLWVSGGDARS